MHGMMIENAFHSTRGRPEIMSVLVCFRKMIEA